MKNVIKFMWIFISIVLLSGCSRATLKGDEEGVFTKQPYIFGTGGVDTSPMTQGSEYYAWSTHLDVFKTSPVQYKESFEDMITSNNTPISLDCFLILQMEKGQSPQIVLHFGPNWYANNVQQPARQEIRNEVCKYDMFRLTSDRQVYDTINNNIFTNITALLKEKGLPVKLAEVITSRAIPNADVIEEMNKTGAAIQAKQTQDRRKESEDSRQGAEKSRALADKAYMVNLNLTVEEFIQLRSLEINKELIEMAKAKNGNFNIDFLIGGQNANVSPIWSLKK